MSAREVKKLLAPRNVLADKHRIGGTQFAAFLLLHLSRKRGDSDMSLTSFRKMQRLVHLFQCAPLRAGGRHGQHGRDAPRGIAQVPWPAAQLLMQLESEFRIA